MKTLVVYDSAFGNTAKVAEAINDALRPFGNTKSTLVSNIKKEELKHLDFLIIGSPTQGGRPTEPISQLIDELPKEVIDSAKLLVFDTRLEAKDQKKPLQLLMKVIGYAAPKMALALKQRGCSVISKPQGFIVNGKEGPLRDGEINRSARWAKEALSTYKTR